MNRLLCRLLGHRWQNVFTGQHSVAVVCLRCRENGWRIRQDWHVTTGVA